MKFLKITSFASALAFAASGAIASEILIDDFSAAGVVTSNSGGNPATLEVGDPGIVGDARFMWVSGDAAPTPANNTAFEAGFNGITGSTQLGFSNSGGATGQAVLVYDGVGAGAGTETFDFISTPASLVPSADFPTGTTAEIAVNTTGLATGLDGIDFLDGFDILQRGIEFEFASFDPGGQLQFEAYAWDMSGNRATFGELLENNTGIPTDVSFDTTLGLSEFIPDGGMFDWENVGAIAFSVESLTPEFDGVLTSISVVPLPLSSLLILGGLGGLAGANAVSKRRRKA